MVKAHNDWCIRVAGISPRIRPVATILTRSLKDALEESERLIDGGVRAVVIPTGYTIEGRAPAHPDNDSLWALYAKNNIAVTVHVGGEKAFLREYMPWVNAPQFAVKDDVPSELNIDPFTMATISLGPQNYITNLVLGGVFERVPDLRFGIIELGGHWIGPTAENMDVWAAKFPKSLRGVISMKPSEYIQRNVRVTPFNFEPVDKYMDRFPYLQDVYCFSTDYPHYEGGKEPIKVMMSRIERFGPDVIEKYFVTNAEWLLPS